LIEFLKVKHYQWELRMGAYMLRTREKVFFYGFLLFLLLLVAYNIYAWDFADQLLIDLPMKTWPLVVLAVGLLGFV